MAGGIYPHWQIRNPLFERLAALWRKKNPAEDGVLLSRKPGTQAAYEARIDALFAGSKASRVGAKVLDRSDMLGLLGYSEMPVHLQESKVLQGLTNHPNMTAEVWKKIPRWLDQPAAAFNSETVPGRLVFVAPDLVNGSLALLVVEPDATVDRGLTAHLLVNAYDKDGGAPPIGRWARDGLTRYVDKKKFPAILDASGLQLPGTAFQNKPGTSKILSEKHLAGYMRAHADTALSRAPSAADRANDILSQKAGSRAPLDALAKGLTRITGIERLTGAIYNKAGYLLDRYTPETIKAGILLDSAFSLDQSPAYPTPQNSKTEHLESENH